MIQRYYQHNRQACKWTLTNKMMHMQPAATHTWSRAWSAVSAAICWRKCPASSVCCASLASRSLLRCLLSPASHEHDLSHPTEEHTCCPCSRPHAAGAWPGQRMAAIRCCNSPTVPAKNQFCLCKQSDHDMKGNWGAGDCKRRVPAHPADSGRQWLPCTI